MPGCRTVTHWFFCLPATEFVWIASFSVPCVIAGAEFHFFFFSSASDHSSGVFCRNVDTNSSFRASLAVFFGSMTSCCVVVFPSDVLLTFFLFCLHYGTSFPPSLFCSFCACLRRCKQVHTPLIPASAGPPQCGAVWGIGGHGTRRGFWIQSIQKRPGSFLAKF